MPPCQNQACLGLYSTIVTSSSSSEAPANQVLVSQAERHFINSMNKPMSVFVLQEMAQELYFKIPSSTHSGDPLWSSPNQIPGAVSSESLSPGNGLNMQWHSGLVSQIKSPAGYSLENSPFSMSESTSDACIYCQQGEIPKKLLLCPVLFKHVPKETCWCCCALQAL